MLLHIAVPKQGFRYKVTASVVFPRTQPYCAYKPAKLQYRTDDVKNKIDQTGSSIFYAVGNLICVMLISLVCDKPARLARIIIMHT